MIIISNIHYGEGRGGGFNRKNPNIIFSEDFGTQKIGGRYHNFRLNRSEGFNKIFGVGILENLLVAKSEGICIQFVLSHFLIIFGDIIAKN